MHLSVLSPRVEGAGNTREFDSESLPLSRDFDTKTVFILGARALVPGHRHKMVLC